MAIERIGPAGCGPVSWSRPSLSLLAPRGVRLMFGICVAPGRPAHAALLTLVGLAVLLCAVGVSVLRLVLFFHTFDVSF